MSEDERLIKPISPFRPEHDQSGTASKRPPTIDVGMNDMRPPSRLWSFRSNRTDRSTGNVAVPGFSVNVSKGGLGIEVDHLPHELPSSLLGGCGRGRRPDTFRGCQGLFQQAWHVSGYVCRDAVWRARCGRTARRESCARSSTLKDPVARIRSFTEYVWTIAFLSVCTEPDCSATKFNSARDVAAYRHFVTACRKCGSARVKRDELIHHYACAHVDYGVDISAQWRTARLSRNVVPPRLVVGSDFEYLEGQYQCLDCQWQDSSLESIAHCLKCNYRFAAA